MAGLYVGLMAGFLLLSALFALMEAAYLSVQRSRVRRMAAEGVSGGPEVERIIQEPERMLATVLLSNNVANTAVAVLGSAVAVSLWGPRWGVVIATAAVAAVVFLLGDTLPKSFATRHPERVAFLTSGVMGLMQRALSPMITAVTWMSTRATGGGPMRQALSEEDIRFLITIGHEQGAVEETAAKMLHRVFEFGDRLVKEVMTPRTEVVAVPLGTSLKDFFHTYGQHPYSRFPVYRGSLEEVEGILAVKDVLMALAQGTLTKSDYVDILMRPASFVPETKPLGELLPVMQAQGWQMAVVVDEYGGVAGVVTLDEMVEEIVGSVRDEMGWEGQEWETINESTFQVDGGLQVEEANEMLGLELPEGEYQTVAGLFLSLLGRIPREGETVRQGNLKLVVTQMRGRKIEKILITRE
ncbi:MAG: hemolysin family protein [Dehalococcoidia bacterium]|nr:hemolysin family protein [Dehalococcoidia bacterium]